MARRELLEFCWLGGVRWTRGQCQQQIAKVFAGGYRKEFEGVDHHVGVAAVRQMEFDGHAVWIGVGGPSGIFGMPVESENRTVAGIELPLNNTARLSPAASGDALKLP